MYLQLEPNNSIDRWIFCYSIISKTTTKKLTANILYEEIMTTIKKSMQIFFPLSYSYFETFLAALYFGSSIFCSSYYDQEADLCLYEITSNHSYLKS